MKADGSVAWNRARIRDTSLKGHLYQRVIPKNTIPDKDYVSGWMYIIGPLWGSESRKMDEGIRIVLDCAHHHLESLDHLEVDSV